MCEDCTNSSILNVHDIGRDLNDVPGIGLSSKPLPMYHQSNTLPPELIWTGEVGALGHVNIILFPVISQIFTSRVGREIFYFTKILCIENIRKISPDLLYTKLKIVIKYCEKGTFW